MDTHNHHSVVPKMQSRASAASSSGKSSNNKKILVIKNLKRRVPDGQRDYFVKSKEQIMKAVEDILDGNQPHLPLEKLYRDVEDLVKEGSGEEIYGMLKKKMTSFLTEFTKFEVKDGDQTGRGKSYLENTLYFWDDWVGKMIAIRSLFNFLDRAVLINHRHLLSLDHLSIELFRQCVLDENVITDKIFSDINSLINEDRKDPTQPPEQKPLLVNIIRMLSQVGIYKPFFEDAFLSASEDYFRRVIADRADLEPFIRRCTAVLDNEATRATVLNLESSTKNNLIKKAEDIITKHVANRMLQNPVDTKKLFSNKESPRIMYNLLKRKGLESELRRFWEESIRERGTNIVTSIDKADEAIAQVALYKKFCDSITTECFGGDEAFGMSTRTAFAAFINDRNKKHPWGEGKQLVGKLIAKYVDMLLRGGLKTLPKELLTSNEEKKLASQPGQQVATNDDEELDRQLTLSLELFRFIDGKDVFEGFYKSHFAKRLLMKRSVSDDAERSMLTKLKGECGSQFTHNLETMLKDVDVSGEEMNKFFNQDNRSAAQRSKLQLNVTVLTSATWPNYPDVPCNMPVEVKNELEAFENFYINEHRGRNLTWKNMLSHGILTANLPNGKKEFQVSGFQAVVLLLFNDVAADDVLSYDAIRTATGLPEAELKVNLQSLACGKIHILKKSPRGKEISPTDVFALNTSFRDPRFRIKINQIQLKEKPEDEEKVEAKVMEDRQFEMQAAIVRVMKRLKSASSSMLIKEVIELLRKRGGVDVKEIKRNVDKLIDKDYLEREGDGYVYCA